MCTMLPILLIFSISPTIAEVISDIQTGSNLLPGTDVCGQQYVWRPGIVAGIYRGVEAKIGEYPWMAVLVANDNEMDCSGSLINSRYILTAAHCVASDEYPVVSVRLGEHDLKEDPDCSYENPPGPFCAEPMLNVEVEETIIHENYMLDKDLKPQSDIALLRLKQEVKFTRYIIPICLPSITPEFRNETFEHRDVNLAGWGKTEISWKSKKKLHVYLVVNSHDDCVDKYRTNEKTVGEFNISRSHICAKGMAGEDSCSGDSGSPLMYGQRRFGVATWFCIGIVSFGPNVTCEMSEIPGIYTRVTEYNDWIISKLKP